MSKKKKKKAGTKTSRPRATIRIYTDGGCAYNPGGPGGYGVVYLDTETGEIQEASGGYACTTNNRMELRAVIRALEIAKENCPDKPFEIISDSEYVINAATGLWQRRKNTDLWEEYDKARKGLSFDFRWVRGHSGNPDNERCDQLATQAMLSPSLQEDTGYQASLAVGRDFYKAVDDFTAHKPAVSSMTVQIDVPEEYDKQPPFMSAREYAKTYHVHNNCASSIVAFYCEPGHKFKSYVNIKTGGMDTWSRTKKDDLITSAGQEIYDAASQYFSDERSLLSCMRWYCRGLILTDSIRKVLVDNEVTANCRH